MNTEVSADVPDWGREHKPRFAWDPGRSLLACLRTYQQMAARRGMVPLVRRKALALQHRMWSVVAGTDIPLNCRIAGGLVMPHPNGIVIHPAATIGPNCMIFQQVTIGAGAPIIEGHVDIGAGAKILGDVVVGRHAKIGANAVVLTDVPPFATAVGVPARILLAAKQES